MQEHKCAESSEWERSRKQSDVAVSHNHFEIIIENLAFVSLKLSKLFTVDLFLLVLVIFFSFVGATINDFTFVDGEGSLQSYGSFLNNFVLVLGQTGQNNFAYNSANFIDHKERHQVGSEETDVALVKTDVEQIHLEVCELENEAFDKK